MDISLWVEPSKSGLGDKGRELVYLSFYSFPATVSFPVPDISLTCDNTFCIIQYNLVNEIQFSSPKLQ